MKDYKLEITIIIAGIALIIGLASWMHHGPDSPLEEQAEEIIQDATGLDIDISLGSEEKAD